MTPPSIVRNPSNLNLEVGVCVYVFGNFSDNLVDKVCVVQFIDNFILFCFIFYHTHTHTRTRTYVYVCKGPLRRRDRVRYHHFNSCNSD